MKRTPLLRETTLLFAVAILFGVFAITVDGFLDWYNLLERTRYWVVTGMVAVAMTFIIATAGIDLSVGSIVALCGIVLGMAHHTMGMSLETACAAAVLAGLVAGGVNGFVGSYVGVPPLVATLATMALFRGIAMGLSQGNPIREFPDRFRWLSHGNIEYTLEKYGTAYAPAPLVALLAVVFVGGIVLRKTRLGRYAECVGENETAATFAALDPKWVKFVLYSGCGAVCGMASLFQTSLFSTAKADTAMGLELEAIACVVVGGTRISGGDASVIGTLCGLLLIGVLRYGLEMAGVDSQHVIVLVGLLLIAAAVFNEWVSREGGKE